MFFFLSKTIGWIVTPTTFIVALGALGLACLLTRFVSLGRKLMVITSRNEVLRRSTTLSWTVGIRGHFL
jgi:hypothetical protein